MNEVYLSISGGIMLSINDRELEMIPKMYQRVLSKIYSMIDVN